ncbi:MAG: hypothetical protein HY908_11800 [Myxococcales bacterium]|nr:hypothetical protein [Myxococcales bacterium]
MDANIGLSPGTEGNALAPWVATTIARNLLDPALRREFFAVRAAVAIVALEPLELEGTLGQGPTTGAAGAPGARRAHEAATPPLAELEGRTAVTLRFDHGQLTIHDGVVGIPDLTLCGEREVLLGLADLPLDGRFRLPLPRLGRGDNRALRRSLLELATGELKVYGLLGHPRLFVRLLRLLHRSAG